MFQKRSSEVEIIDDFTLSGAEITDTFQSIEKVNFWLGGNQVLVGSLRRALPHLKEREDSKPLMITDLGCGSGDGLRAIARWARQKQLPVQITGLDANAYVVDLASKAAEAFPEISFRQQDILAPDYLPIGADLVTFNLCLHHFSDDQILNLLHKCKAAGVQAILINDLHRHWLAYYLFILVCFVFQSPRIARLDGLLSIRKGFKRSDLLTFVKAIRGEKFSLRWRWAFRYQLIICL